MSAARIAAILLMGAATAPAYYHFIRYANREGRTVALAQKFDLAALTNKTVPYFVSDRFPERLAANDSQVSLLSQIRLAARQWDEVESSDLRLRFGGVTSTANLPASTPSIEVVFDELPPGLLALGGPTSLQDPAPGAQFIPVLRSQIVLPRDLSNTASHSEAFFLTVVHEFGHALGLQHTLTSSAMATQLTRAVTKGRALAADDLAGISLLYPARAFQSSLGSISGRVTLGGSGVPLASVVALSASGAAVSVLTHADGTYRIDGLPPGVYNVYAQPLPPAQAGESTPANIVLPLDPDRQPIQPVTGFELQFYPGVRDASAASAIPVGAAALVEGINFSVNARRDPARLYNVSTFGFPGQVAVRPAPVQVNGPRNFFVATGQGLLTAANQPVAGLQASILGGTTQVTSIRPYSAGYLQFDLGFTAQSGEGAKHLLLSTATESYVQPGAIQLTNRPPPQISSIGAADSGNLAITGTNLDTQTSVWFDGVRAIVRAAENNRLIVTPPPALAGHRAAVTATNPDGQSSLFLQPEGPPLHAYESGEAPSLTVTPSTLVPGIETAIEIAGSGSAFQEGWTTVQFQSPDLAVKRVWVLSPTRLLVQVQVAAGASGVYTPMVTTGLRSALIPGGVTVNNGASLSTSAARLTVTPVSVNSFTGVASAVTGGQLVVLLSAPAGSNIAATLGERPISVTALAGGIYGLQIPSNFPIGPAILRIQLGSESAVPIALQVDAPGTVSFEDRTYPTGDTVSIATAGFTEFSNPLARPRAIVSIGGVDHPARIAPGGVLQVTILPAVPSGSHPLIASVDGRPSVAATITVRSF